MFNLDVDQSKVHSYRKIHLFDVQVPNGPCLRESETTVAGSSIGRVIPTQFGNLGLGICYDLRFPEFSLLLRQQGMEIMTYPSAFTVPTGSAHWHCLLRARAIELQCYVIAAAQVGQHSESRSSYGHSMIVDPWGKVICELDHEPGLGYAHLDMDYLKKIRLAMPIESHRRLDLYSLQ